ncbi:MAG: hypothetical protein H0U70_13040 [Tatlockia sp.]|nr:hypothetical protein [Tatlockia sp.]
MNRLALITMTAFLTVALSACGDRTEKKVEVDTNGQPAQVTQPTSDTTVITTPSDTTKTNP